MALLENPDLVDLGRQDFDAAGNLRSDDAELQLVIGAWQEATDYIAENQWKLEWRDCDILYNSPRPYSVWEGTYTLEPNLRRFTVAKLTNSIVPQAHKGLFYEDPPMMIRPGPNTSHVIAQAKMALMGALMREMNFKREAKLCLEQWGLLGTCVAKAGVRKKLVTTKKRSASSVDVPAGPMKQKIYKDEPPQITETTKLRTVPFFEWRNINEGDSNAYTIAWDPKSGLPDIRECKWVVERRMVDFFDLQELAKDPDYDIPGAVLANKPEDVTADEDGNVVAGGLIDLWFEQAETDNKTPTPTAGQQANSNVVIHAEDQSSPASNPLREKLEILEYLDQDKGTIICVLNQKAVIRSGEAYVKYFSANFWNRPNALVGLGIGQISGQDQRLEQGITNSALKVLAMNLNQPYLRSSDSNTPNQMMRTGIGKVITVQDVEKAYKLLESPKVDPSVWTVLQDSRRESESSTGADQTLVQGSSAGPRSGMGRTSGGANIMAGASAARLEGPLDNFIDQVFVPFLYCLDEIIYNHMTDHEIVEILGEELGDEFVQALDMQEFHDGRCDYDVLAGAALAAKRTMIQSMEVIMQYVGNANNTELMADIHQEYFDPKEIFKMILVGSEWGQGVENSIVKKMTPQMIQRRQQQQQTASKSAAQMALQKDQQQAEAQLEDQKTQNRIARDLIVKTATETAGPEAGDSSTQTGGTEA